MKTLRSSQASYVAAFLLGGLIAALLAYPSRGASPLQLYVADGDVLIEMYSVPEDVFD